MSHPRRVPWFLALAFFLAYSLLSIIRHVHLRSTAYDLGIFEQAVRAYAHLRAPIVELKGPGFNLLGDHFHPILVLLAPFYRIAPSPVTLLVAQAALFAVSVVPVTRLATLKLGERAGLGIGIAYGLSWGIQQAVYFDFHEIAFAVPLLAFSLERLVLGQYKAAAALALQLLLVKEDLAATVVAVGVLLFFYGQRRLGLAVVAVAVVVGILALTVVVPALNPEHTYAYLGRVEPAQSDPFSRLFTPGIKYATVALLLLPTCFVALRSPLVLLAVPTLLWRFWSTYPTYWGTGFHYDAVLMPILFVAFVDGLARLKAGPAPANPALRTAVDWLRRAAVPVALVVAVGLVALGQPLRRLVEPSYWRAPEAVAAGKRVLDLVPDGAVVAASNRLAPQLTARCQVYLFPMQPTSTLRPKWVVVTDDIGPSPLTHEEEKAAIAKLPAQGYVAVRSEGGVTLYLLALSAVIIPKAR